MGIWLILGVFCAFWLVFMLFFPEKWDTIVEKENRFWVEKGLIKDKIADQMANFEKGMGQKIFVGLAMIGFFVCAWLMS